jgi:hypothetical protein
MCIKRAVDLVQARIWSSHIRHPQVPIDLSHMLNSIAVEGCAHARQRRGSATLIQALVGRGWRWACVRPCGRAPLLRPIRHGCAPGQPLIAADQKRCVPIEASPLGLQSCAVFMSNLLSQLGRRTVIKCQAVRLEMPHFAGVACSNPVVGFNGLRSPQDLTETD